MRRGVKGGRRGGLVGVFSKRRVLVNVYYKHGLDRQVEGWTGGRARYNC